MYMETKKEENESFNCSIYIPESLVSVILSWLPPKTLTRFKCVSKSWTNLIHDPFFVLKHLHNSSTSSSTASMFMSTSISVETSLRILNDNDGKAATKLRQRGLVKTFNVKKNNDNDGNSDDPIHCSTSYIELPFPQEIEIPYLQMGSHCNGLICFFNIRFGTVYLCNPAINEFRILNPTSSFHNISEIRTASLGLGYDSKAKDYKIIRIGCMPCGNDLAIVAELYTLCSNSWKRIEFDADGKKMMENFGVLCVRFNAYVYCKGVYYWLLCVPEGKFEKQMILFFDFCDEQFSLIPTPQNGREEVYWKSIQVWNERIAVFSTSSSSSTSSNIEMWVMRDIGSCTRSSSGWTKHAVIELKFHLGYPCIWSFWKSDELLMIFSSHDYHEMETNYKVLSCNFFTRKLRVLINFFGNELHGSFFSYVKSMVSVKGTTTQGNNNIYKA